MMKKLLLVILDGGADKGRSAFAAAKKPYLDLLASNSTCGLWRGAVSANKRSLSGIATLEILGYSEKDDPGRGYLEALGLDIKVPKDAICLRGNFSTIKDGKLIDRRAGRDHSGLDEMVFDLNKKIPAVDGVKTKIYRLVGHRFVLVLFGKGLSPKISDSDVSNRIEKLKALEKNGEKTADILNEYVKKAADLLSAHPANKKRKIPANYILLRSPGSFQKSVPFRKKYGVTGCVISGVNIVLGVSRYIGFDILETPPAELETDLFVRARKAIDALDKYDIVVLHINGLDVYSHDKDFQGKVRYLEKIDAEVFSQLVKLRNVNIAVICDHITCTSTGEHEFGPVPFLIYDSQEEDDVSYHGFDEKACQRSFLADNPMKKIMSVI